MHRFHLPPGECMGDRLALPGREAHHALNVLRLRRGDSVCVLDGAGTVCDCIVDEATHNSFMLRVTRRETAPRPVAEIRLCQALPKGKTFETIIQKATELQASRIVPLLTERVVAHIPPAEAPRKAEKWQLFAVEAIKQSGSPWLPEVAAPISLKDFLGQGQRTELSLVGSLHPGAKHPRTWFRQFEQQRGRRPKSVSIWVGPEGDFTPAEIDMILGAGARPITLGPVILRADTAAICSLSIVNHELTAPPAVS